MVGARAATFLPTNRARSGAPDTVKIVDRGEAIIPVEDRV